MKEVLIFVACALGGLMALFGVLWLVVWVTMTAAVASTIKSVTEEVARRR